jgi:hypothetical protein
LKCDQYHCKYGFTSCAIRRKRTTFKADELATTFVSLWQQKRVDGLFLSSGIVPDANTTMEKMLATVERLRLREGYTGYIHLKLIPGAAFEYIERAVELADRVSLNLEAPNQARLSKPGPSATSMNRSKLTGHRAMCCSRFPALARRALIGLSPPAVRHGYGTLPNSRRLASQLPGQCPTSCSMGGARRSNCGYANQPESHTENRAGLGFPNQRGFFQELLCCYFL